MCETDSLRTVRFFMSKIVPSRQYVCLRKDFEMGNIPWQEELIEGELPDRTTVKAMCWYWAKDVNVEMISPYPGLRTGRHMMYMIPMRFTDGELWKERA